MPNKVRILWGSSGWREPTDTPVGYSFNTPEELDAFMLGVESMDGWAGYEVTYDSREEA